MSSRDFSLMIETFLQDAPKRTVAWDKGGSDVVKGWLAGIVNMRKSLGKK